MNNSAIKIQAQGPKPLQLCRASLVTDEQQEKGKNLAHAQRDIVQANKKCESLLSSIYIDLENAFALLRTAVS